ncbi:MAG: ZIP family metal transporter [Sporichthyaceae bacterium]
MRVLEAGMWGLVAGIALLIGAVIGVRVKVPTRIIGLVMALGAGVLISAVAFELAEEAFQSAGSAVVVTGLVAGAAVFFLGDLWIDKRGGANRKRSGNEQAGGAGMALVLGALLDGIPESLAIGASLLGGGAVGIPVVVAVFLSNIPEGLAAATGLRSAGRSVRWILTLWGAVVLVSGIAAALGFALLGDADSTAVAVTQAFAAGAILTMLADTMMPEALDKGGNTAGLVTTLGFILAFLLSHV